MAATVMKSMGTKGTGTLMAIMSMGTKGMLMVRPTPRRMCMGRAAGTSMPITIMPTAPSLTAKPTPPMASRATFTARTAVMITAMAMPATSMAESGSDDPSSPAHPAMPGRAGERPQADAAAPISLLPLFAWLTPSFPVGAYAYSHTLEWAVEAGDIKNEDSLGAFLGDLLALGFGRSDAILAAHAHRAAVAGDETALAEVNALAVALASSAELRLETCQQGRSFLDAVCAAWPAPGLDAAASALVGEVAYPVAVGLAAGIHGLPLAPTLEAFLLATVQNLVSAAVRLAPIGQTAGTRVVARLAPTVHALALEIPALTLDDLGSATFRADLGSFRHETQYTRLFRS